MIHQEFLEEVIEQTLWSEDGAHLESLLVQFHESEQLGSRKIAML